MFRIFAHLGVYDEDLVAAVPDLKLEAFRNDWEAVATILSGCMRIFMKRDAIYSDLDLDSVFCVALWPIEASDPNRILWRKKAVSILDYFFKSKRYFSDGIPILKGDGCFQKMVNRLKESIAVGNASVSAMLFEMCVDVLKV